MEGFTERGTVAHASSDTNLGDSTEVPSAVSSHGSRLLPVSSELGLKPIPVTTSNSVSSYVAGDVNIRPYHSNSALGYAAHLSEVPLPAGYLTEPTRYASQIPSTSTVSAYDPRNYTYNSGGFPLQQRQDLGYSHLSQSYISQTHPAGLRTDTETYNAALALVQSQNKIFTDDSGGQFYQLDSGSPGNTNYEAVRAGLVNNSSQRLDSGDDGCHVEKIMYVSETPQIQIMQVSNTAQADDRSSLEKTSEDHVEVVVETVELADGSIKASVLQDDTLVVLKADSTIDQNYTQPKRNVADKSSNVMTENHELKKQPLAAFGETQETLKSTVAKIDEIYKDKAVQIEGPDLECRFGVFREELREDPGGKACCIKLKPIKRSFLDESYNRIVFDIEVDNELNVSSIEKTYLNEKTSSYSFCVSTQKEAPEAKPTSQNTQKSNSDRVSISVDPNNKSLVVVNFKGSKKLIKENKEEVNDRIMTRASKRKMAKPIKKTALKNLGKSENRRGNVNFKNKSKKDKISKTSEKDESRQKKSKLKNKCSVKLDSSGHSAFEEDEADKSDDYNSMVDNTAEQESDFERNSISINSPSKASQGVSDIEVKTEQTETSELDNEIEATGKTQSGYKIENNSGAENQISSEQDTDVVREEKGSEKKKRKKKDGTAEGEESRPKRKYTKRDNVSKTELNYTVRKTETGKRVYTCPICLRDFNQVGNVTEHIRTHTGEKPYSCSVCNKAFSSRSNVNSHMLVHQTERNIVCGQCGFAFKNQRALNRHSRHHMNDRRWTCHYCGKSFYENGQLIAHLRIHTGEKPYTCKYCPKVFRERSAWVRHMDIHIGRMLHQCHVCGKGFSRKDNYVTHLKTHQNEKEGIHKNSPGRARNQKTQTGNVVEHEEEVAADSEENKVQKIYLMIEERTYVNANDFVQPRVVTQPNTTNYGGELTFNLTDTGIENI